LHRGPLEWQHLPTKYHEDLPQAVIGGRHTDRQAGDLIILLSFLESGLKRALLASSKPITGIVSQLVQAYPKKTFAVYLHKRY
jgi:hypothetical protein